MSVHGERQLLRFQPERFSPGGGYNKISEWQRDRGAFLVGGALGFRSQLRNALAKQSWGTDWDPHLKGKQAQSCKIFLNCPWGKTKAGRNLET